MGKVGGAGAGVGVGVGVVVPEFELEVEPVELVELDVVEPLEVDEDAGVDAVEPGVVVADVELCVGWLDAEVDALGAELDDEGAKETGHDWPVAEVSCGVPVVEDVPGVDVAAVGDGLVALVVLAAGVEVPPPAPV